MCKDVSISNTTSGGYDGSHDEYDEFSASVVNQFNSAIQEGKPLFKTIDLFAKNNLFDLYLNGLPVEARQCYNCIACKNFIEKFGNLVTISDNGTMESAMWNPDTTPEFFRKSVSEMQTAVLSSKVHGVFLSTVQELGVPTTGEWSHLSVKLPKNMILKSKLKNAEQQMAEKLEDFKTLINAIKIYPKEAVTQAVLLLNSEVLYRSENVLGIAQWFKDVIEKHSNAKNSIIKNNILWKAVATAPTGFCHVKNTVIGTLLDDIVKGCSFESAKHNFDKKMDPTKYQRPQVPPSSGNRAQAEKIVAELGIEKSLERRFARIDEIDKIWEPKPKKETVKSDGIFSHIETKDNKKHSSIPEMLTPAVIMTFKKFLETVLPNAESIEYLVESRPEAYAAILTAQHFDAPPIIQWDNEDRRNPFSAYVYNGGSVPGDWNICLKGYCKVTAICYRPNMWYGNTENQNQSQGVLFILDGAKDTRYEQSGNALFPEILKSELREIRSTIEAYSKKATNHGYEEASACGLLLDKSRKDWGNPMFKVTTAIGVTTYKLDRWD